MSEGNDIHSFGASFVGTVKHDDAEIPAQAVTVTWVACECCGEPHVGVSIVDEQRLETFASLTPDMAARLLVALNEIVSEASLVARARNGDAVN